ncbi:MAG: xylan esterase [Saprospiraceae bacterium]|nr:xylan esterase [Saprospiraceae bacterium]
MKYRIFWQLLCSLFISLPATCQDDVDLFNYWSYYSDVENSLYKYFCDVAFDQLDQRKQTVNRLKTREDWERRQQEVKRRMKDIVGSFPDKTPLNIQVTGTVQKNGFSVEKLVYESRPGYHVTAALFIPENLVDPAPAILNPIGHSTLSFRRDIYQHTIINLVKKGFIVLAYDPIGQGERLQYYDPALGKSIFPSNHEHSYPGAQCFISGYSPASYFIWDGIRGLDVLESRPEVDPQRIGMTGISGGGTSTAQICVFDDRILAAAPECYITNYNRLFRSEGPQDAEQNLVRFIAEGLDHPDFIALRAPKPTLIVSTTRDFFSIQGAMESYHEAGEAFAALGEAENLQMTIDDDRHSFTKKNREAMYAFFQKHLQNPGDPTDQEIEPLSLEELQVTPTGQVSTSFQGETMYSLNKKVVENQVEKLNARRRNIAEHLPQVRRLFPKIAGITVPEEFGSAVFSGRFVGAEYAIEKYLIPGSGAYMLPLALCIPTEKQSSEVVLILHQQGKDYAINEDGLTKELLAQGFTVLLADLPDIGEMGPGYLRGDTFIRNVSYNKWFAGILTGKTIVGLRAEDIIRMINFLHSDRKYESIAAISIGTLGSELLHALAISQDVAKVCLIESFQGYADIALSQEYRTEYIHSTVPGAIEAYDLPDLAALIAPRKLMILNPLSANGDTVDESVASKNFAFPSKAFVQQGVKDNFSLRVTSREEASGSVLAWLSPE